MNRIKIAFIVWLLCLVHGNIYAQDCKIELATILLEHHKNFNPKKKFLLDYSVQIDYRNSVESVSDHFVLVSSAHKSYIKSVGYEIFKDDSLMVTINERSKSIFISIPGPNDVPTNMIQYQDSLINSASKITCTESSNNKSFFLELSKEIVEKYKVRIYSLEIDLNTKKIQKTVLFYSDGPISKAEYRINKYEETNKDPFYGSAIDQLESKKYENYRLVDVRSFKTTPINEN